MWNGIIWEIKFHQYETFYTDREVRNKNDLFQFFLFDLRYFMLIDNSSR